LELEDLHLLSFAVLGDREIVDLQAFHGVAALVFRGDVEHHQLGFRLELVCLLLQRRIRLLNHRRPGSLLRSLLRISSQQPYQKRRGDNSFCSHSDKDLDLRLNVTARTPSTAMACRAAGWLPHSRETI
jgi:hypothetical protein